MIAHPQQIAVTVGIAALVAWRLSVRIRRLVTRQRLSVRRQWITAVLFSLLPFALLPGVEATHAAVWPLPVGLIAGIILGIIGLRLTAFESDHTGHHYQPNVYLGAAIAGLFILRLGYRLVDTRGLHSAGATHHAPHLDPITLGLFGLLAGFFAAQAIGILFWYYRRSGRTEHD